MLEGLFEKLRDNLRVTLNIKKSNGIAFIPQGKFPHLWDSMINISAYQ